MPVATYALTGDFSGLVGEVSSIRATVNTNSIDGGWVNDVDNTIVLGGTVLAVGADGKFTVTLPTSTGTGLQYQVTAEFTDGSRNRKVWESGWFSLTAAGDLADLANDSTLRVTQTLGDQLAARIDGYQDHGDVSGVLTVDPAIGTHVLVATGSLLVTLDAAPDGRIVTLYVVSGASSVTVDGITGLTLTDGSFASFVRIRGAWVLASAGGATGPADTTPPSNVTGLTATGGSGSLTASWTASTDAESSVSYRYRYWLTSGGATGAWTTTTATSFTVASGVTAGAYTVQVYAYSAGGQQTTPTSATATVTAPAGWSVLASDNFTGTDGTVIKGRTTPVGGIVWDGDTAPIISGNKAVWQAPTADAGLVLPLAAAASASGVEVSFDCAVAPQVDTSLPYIEFIFPNSPIVRFDCTGAGAGQVSVRGYNSSSVSGQTLAGPVTTTATANVGARRVGNLIQVLVDGAVAIEHNLVGGYAAYIGAATPNTVTVIGYAFKTSSLDNFQARVLS